MLLCTCADFGVKNTFSSDSPIPSTKYNIVVDRVFPNSPAARGGLRPGDRILSVDGQKVFSPKELLNILAKIFKGENSQFTILRDRDRIKLNLVAGMGNYRFGFRFKTPDPEIAKQLKFTIWPENVNRNFKQFTILFQDVSLINKTSRSPQKKVLYHLKELLLNKGYFFTDNVDKADFIVKAVFKYSKKNISTPIRRQKKNKLPFEAIRVLFQEKNEQEPFLKVSGVLDPGKAKKYGTKGYVYSMLDAMIEKFPIYWNREDSKSKYVASEKKFIDDQAKSFKKRFPGVSPF